jgi:N-acetylglucosaminyldiphosphoundecaprenol N-acetyl-beta-D-mannosaminyltransferase
MVAPRQATDVEQVPMLSSVERSMPEAGSAATPLGVPDAEIHRAVHGLMGIPIDAVLLDDALKSIAIAIERQTPTLISTPNLSFLTTSLHDPEFRRSLMLSAFCPVDGMPLVWISRLIGVPIQGRVAGSDIFQKLRTSRLLNRPIRVFFLGGQPGMAEAAAAAINAADTGMRCVGWLNPGFGSVEEMSTPEIIDRINASNADFLVVSLGAQKGQKWLLLNHHRITVPIRSYLGAVVGFQSGKLRRAPPLVRKLGFEWLWRIKEEPYLWRRYWRDGWVFLRLLLGRALPLVAINARRRWTGGAAASLVAHSQSLPTHTLVTLTGAAIATQVETAVASFPAADDYSKDVWVDLSGVSHIDARFFGLFLMLWKKLDQQGRRLCFVGLNRSTRRLFRLNAFEFLLDPQGA